MSEIGMASVGALLPYETSSESAGKQSNAKLSFFFLCLFTIAVYGRPEDFLPRLGQWHLTLLLGICAGLTFVGSLFAGNASLHRSRELPFMLLLTLWFMVGIPFAFWRGGSFDVFTQIWLKTLLIFFLLTQTLLSVGRIRAVLWAIVLSEFAVSAYSILNPSQSAWVGDRMSGINQGILGWNFLGIAASLTIPYIAILFIDRHTFVGSCLLALATLAMLWMLVLTASRSGMLMVMFSIVMTSAFILRGTPRGKAIGLVLVLGLVTAVCIAPGVFWQRMQTIWTDSSPTTQDAASADMSEAERSEVLMRSIHYTVEHPIFGLGLGNFSVASGTELGRPEGWLGAHNSYTEISSEAGIPALIIFVAMILATMSSMRKIGRTDFYSSESQEINRMAQATWISLISFLFGACFAHISYQYYLYYPIAIAAGVDYIARRTPVITDSHQPVEWQRAWDSAPVETA